MNLESLKVGDSIVASGWHGISAWRVTAETKTQLVCGNVRFNKLTGRLVGSSGYNITTGRIATPDDLIEIRVQRAQQRLAKIKVTADNIDVVEAFLKALV